MFGGRSGRQGRAEAAASIKGVYKDYRLLRNSVQEAGGPNECRTASTVEFEEVEEGISLKYEFVFTTGTKEAAEAWDASSRS